MLIDQGVAMTTRDGATLRADVYRPDARRGLARTLLPELERLGSPRTTCRGGASTWSPVIGQRDVA